MHMPLGVLNEIGTLLSKRSVNREARIRSQVIKRELSSQFLYIGKVQSPPNPHERQQESKMKAYESTNDHTPRGQRYDNGDFVYSSSLIATFAMPNSTTYGIPSSSRLFNDEELDPDPDEAASESFFRDDLELGLGMAMRIVV